MDKNEKLKSLEKVKKLKILEEGKKPYDTMEPVETGIAEEIEAETPFSWSKMALRIIASG